MAARSNIANRCLLVLAALVACGAPPASAQTAPSDAMPPAPGQPAETAIRLNANGEANNALVRAFLKALEMGDVAAHRAMIDPASKMHGLTGDRSFRVAQTDIGEVCEMCAALPDRKIAIDLIVAERDLVAVRSTWSGTYSGSYRGMMIANPTPVIVRYVNIYRIANGKIAENLASMDRQSLAEQLSYTLVKTPLLAANAGRRPGSGPMRRDQVQLEEMP